MDKPLHYEIHVTVETNDVQRFIEECGVIGVKPVVIHNVKSDGTGTMLDLITSSKITGSDPDAFNEMKRVADSLQSKGFNVVREKIETVPWHPKALVHDANSTEGYFEAHIPIIIAGSRNEINVLKASQLLKMSLSFQEGKSVKMLTCRKTRYKRESFEGDIRVMLMYLKYSFNLKLDLGNGKFPDIEYALYDSNVKHDEIWINS